MKNAAPLQTQKYSFLVEGMTEMSPASHIGRKTNASAGAAGMLLPGMRMRIVDVDGNNVRATVFVECGAMFGKSGPAHLRPLGETLFAQGTASAAASGTYGDALICAGITGTFDMSLPQETLEATLEAFRAVPNFRGVRTGPSDAGLALLEKHGLVFETGLGAGAAEIAKKHPNLKIVCNHCCGRPSSGEEVTTTQTAC